MTGMPMERRLLCLRVLRERLGELPAEAADGAADGAAGGGSERGSGAAGAALLPRDAPWPHEPDDPNPFDPRAADGAAPPLLRPPGQLRTRSAEEARKSRLSDGQKGLVETLEIPDGIALELGLALVVVVCGVTLATRLTWRLVGSALRLARGGTS